VALIGAPRRLPRRRAQPTRSGRLSAAGSLEPGVDFRRPAPSQRGSRPRRGTRRGHPVFDPGTTNHVPRLTPTRFARALRRSRSGGSDRVLRRPPAWCRTVHRRARQLVSLRSRRNPYSAIRHPAARAARCGRCCAARSSGQDKGRAARIRLVMAEGPARGAGRAALQPWLQEPVHVDGAGRGAERPPDRGGANVGPGQTTPAHRPSSHHSRSIASGDLGTS